MKAFYDVIIVGSGPGGMGTCFRILEGNPKLSVLMLEAQKTQAGGMRNDCKMNFSNVTNFPKDVWTDELADIYIEQSKKYLEPNIMPHKFVEKYIDRANRYNTKLHVIPQSHIGTDKSLAYINYLLGKLTSMGMELRTSTEVVDIDYENRICILKNGEKIGFNKIVLSVGRAGANWLQSIMTKLDISYIDNVVDIGIRIETKKERYSIVDDYYDPKFILPKQVRTFCTNSGSCGVVRESYDGYFSCNGHALSDERESNGLVNFALLKTITLTEPLQSGTKYAQMIGKLFMGISNGKPIMQRVGDLRAGKRSKEETFNDDMYDFKPTLKSCMCGDITLAFPYKIWNDLWGALKILDNISPGILHPSTIIYAPEIKLYSNKPVFIDEYFKVKDGVYVHSDGAGTSRGIVGAFSSGLRCGDGIIKQNI